MKYENLVLTAGHGKSNSTDRDDPGAVAKDGTTEREIVVEISKYVFGFFEEWKKDFCKTFGVNERLSLDEKVREVNKFCEQKNLDYKNSLLIELHADWSGASEGVSGYFYDGSKESEEFASIVFTETAKAGNRGMKWKKPDTASRFGSLGIIRNTNPLAILVETGSLRSDSEEQDGLELLKSKKGQRDIAFRIFLGVLKFIGEELPKNGLQEKVDLSISVNSAMWEALEGMKKQITEMQKGLSETNNALRS